VIGRVTALVVPRLPFHTIGHSTLSIEEFTAMLRGGQVTRIVDIRSITRSRTNPQFNEATLPRSLASHGISYQHLAALGGRRSLQRDIPPGTNAFWNNRSFHNYADYALHPAFREGLEQLRATGQNERCAIMCAESLWWRCHRRIVADYLIAAGETVRHIMAGRIEDAHLTSAARVLDNETVVYPCHDGGYNEQ